MALGRFGLAAAPLPGWLPAGFRAYRAGMAGPTVAVRTWTDGRGRVKGRSTTAWPGGRVFGDLGQLVRPAGLGAGVAYRSEDGSRVAVHGKGVDLLVTGSVSGADLARVAASLPVTGRPVPAGGGEGGAPDPPRGGAGRAR